MTATDSFASYQKGLSAPADDCFAITPADGSEFSAVTRAIYVGGSGDVVIVSNAGSEVTFKNVVAGSMIPIRARGVSATGTTATYLVGLV